MVLVIIEAPILPEPYQVPQVQFFVDYTLSWLYGPCHTTGWPKTMESAGAVRAVVL